MTEPDRLSDLNAILAALAADAEDEATLQLLAATHDEDEGQSISRDRIGNSPGNVVAADRRRTALSGCCR